MTPVEDKGLIRNRRSIPCRPWQINNRLENSASGLNLRWKMWARSAVLRRTSFESRLRYCLDAELGSFLN
jgi:hypothetical protein